LVVGFADSTATTFLLESGRVAVMSAMVTLSHKVRLRDEIFGSCNDHVISSPVGDDSSKGLSQEVCKRLQAATL
jgi:hypothetical protein